MQVTVRMNGRLAEPAQQFEFQVFTPMQSQQ